MGLNRYLLLLVFALTGCSFRPLTDEFSNKLTIFLQDHSSLVSLLQPPFNVQAPATISDFDCFAVNITGPGVQVDSERFQGCSINGGAGAQTFGYFSDPFTRGSSISAEISAGPARRIDVYGVYPSTGIPECGGSGSGGDEAAGYFVGSRTVDLKESMSVAVPVTFAAGTTASLNCDGNQGSNLHVVNVDGTSANGRYWSSCGDAATIASNNIPPSTSNVFTSPDRTLISTLDSSFLYTECSYGGVNFNISMTEFIVYGDLSTLQTYYDTLTIKWVGAAGAYAAGCSNSPPTGSGVGATPALEVYNDTSGLWETLSTIGTSVQTIEVSITNPAAYYDSATSGIWYRIVAGETNGAGNCSTVRTDYVEFRFEG